jgi:hypothetical protein
MPAGIDFLALVGIAVAVLAIVGALAQSWGADSRELDRATHEPWIGGR